MDYCSHGPGEMDWAFLPPPAITAIGAFLPSAALLRARVINKHWASCLAGVVDTLYVVPEAFLDEDSAKGLPEAFPKATTVNIDLQDTFIAVVKDVKDSFDRQAVEMGWAPQLEVAAGSETGQAAGGASDAASGTSSSQGAGAGDAGAAQPAAAPAAPVAPVANDPPAALQPQAQAPDQQQLQLAAQLQQLGQAAGQQQHPIEALAAAFAAQLINGNAAAAGPGGGPVVAAPPPPPPPTFLHAAIPIEPLPNIVPLNTTHLRVRLPDNADIGSHAADVPTSWTYVASLLGNVGTRLQGLSLSTAPGPAHISMLQPLTQLTSLTMDEASHSAWSNDHISIVGSLTSLRNLAIKIPPFRPTRPEPAPGAPGALWPLTALQQLTKLHISALRYTYHSSLVSVLPSLTRLEYLALRAPQTRLPWPGTERPLFQNIGLLTGLTQLSLSLGDHNMVPQNWQLLTTLSKLSAIELSVSEGSDGLNVPMGLDFPTLTSLKLRYPNSQDLVRIAAWTSVQKLDIKFPEHEREWHQEDACMELLDFASKLPPSPGASIIQSVLENAPAAMSSGTGTAGAPGSASAAGAGANTAAAMGASGTAPGPPAVVVAALQQAQAPTAAGGAAGLMSWWSPLLPLLALPNISDFRCSAKEGLASRDPILFDQILSGLCTSWPGVTRLCFKGCINVASQTAGWDALRALTKLQQLELRHHPPNENDGAAGAMHGNDPAERAAHARFLRVEPIKLPAISLPNSLQTLLLENVELRRKETDCLRQLTSLERRTTCRHFPEFEGMPLQRLVVSNCCVKAKGITSIASECVGLTHLVFAVYKVNEPADLRELQSALRQMVRSLHHLQVLKVRVLAGCITEDLVEDMVAYLPCLQRLKLTSSDGWSDTALFRPLTRMLGLRKCSLAYFKSPEAARLLRAEFRKLLPYCKVKAKPGPA